jgi:hypothetical protein
MAAVAAGKPASLQGNATAKTLPCREDERTTTDPAWTPAIERAMASPSPAPPLCPGAERDRALSTRTKRRKIFSRASSGKSEPVRSP